jgi:hypothetical protein
MRLALALTAALGLAGLSLAALPAPEVHAQDTKAFEDKFAITVTRADGKLQIAIDGKAVKDAGGKEQQWYVNRDYPIRLKVAGAKVAKAELVKADATFEGTEKAGKAKKAKFATAVTDATAASVEYKLVVCSESSCSPPISGTFTETVAVPKPGPKK